MTEIEQIILTVLLCMITGVPLYFLVQFIINLIIEQCFYVYREESFTEQIFDRKFYNKFGVNPKVLTAQFVPRINPFRYCMDNTDFNFDEIRVVQQNMSSI